MKILGASFDTVEENKHFAEKFKFDFPLLCDTDRKIGMAYGAADSPQASNAKRISILISPDGKVQKLYPKIDVKAHPDQVLADIP